MLPQAPRTPSPATLGGAIAKDTSGSAGARYGSIASRVAGLRLVLCDGEILELGEGELDCGGYDIAGLVAGSEGVLAAISEATLALLPATGPAHLLVAEFADTVSAAQAAIGLVSDDFSPAALELVDRSVLAASGAPFEGAGDGRGGAFLLVEIDGGHQDPEPGVARARDRLAGFGARRVDQTGDRALEQRIWRARETASARLARRGSTGHCDLTLPIGHLADFLVRLDEIASASGVAVVHLARPGEGRIESVFIARDDSADGAARVATAVDQADRLAADWGGLTIGEGGAGVVRAVGGGAADLAVQQRLKTVFDGNWTMNRGKVLPGGG
jgi:glycolate oxidase